MTKKRGMSGLLGGASLALLALVLTPAIAATVVQSGAKESAKRPALSLRSAANGFTPAVADPRLAAEFARRGLSAGSFRFTPSVSADKSNKPVTVAVRARSITPGDTTRSADGAAAITAITPTAYSLGVSVGWKRFALSGDVSKFDGGVLPGRESAEVGVSYSPTRNFTGRVAVGAERANDVLPRLNPVDSSYSLDVGGTYSIARNIDVTGGVRYQIDRDRLQPLTDDRRDSQALYVGTAFRF
ncbi:hypothetical protein SAMN06295910_1138 [Allosphingosinicella indica]|uniref:Porin n=1 Tax=Allosphingosinicella indica TaxID=941907 RepID=A0A1X7G4P6_9SPHN|nr:hypothetical protein SAMN06295910_1138 [Allosphingosinicella indica]